MIPWWIKGAWAAMVAVIVPVYAARYGWRNFLWFSDVALLGTAVALWTENRLVASTLAVATLAFESAWAIDFTLALAIGESPLGLTRYMFDAASPAWLRALSLYHVPLVVALVWTVGRLGYDRRALAGATALAAVLLPATRLLTGPAANVNWVYGPDRVQTLLPGPVYVLAMVVLLPVAVFLPTHCVLAKLFASRGPGDRSSPEEGGT